MTKTNHFARYSGYRQWSILFVSSREKKTIEVYSNVRYCNICIRWNIRMWLSQLNLKLIARFAWDACLNAWTTLKKKTNQVKRKRIFRKCFIKMCLTWRHINHSMRIYINGRDCYRLNYSCVCLIKLVFLDDRLAQWNRYKCFHTHNNCCERSHKKRRRKKTTTMARIEIIASDLILNG